MKKGTCAICKAQGVVSDPRSEPPYVHLSCVLKMSRTQSPGPGRLFIRKEGPYPPGRWIRKRLHPAVFEVGGPPQEGSIAEAHPASRPKEAAS